ncbi:MAG: polymerase-binding transcription factor DksA [Pseudomonadota bacterium]
MSVLTNFMKPWGFWLQSRAPDPSLDVSLIDEPLTSTPVRPGAARRLTVNAKTKKTASKKPVPVKKVVKAAAAPKAVANKAVKKPVAAKPVAAKKTPAKPVAAPKAVAKKPAAKAPAKVTKAPVKVAKAPVKTVKAPVKAAKAPAKVVKAPAKVAAKAPVKAVKAPAKVVKAPVKAVKAPAKVVKAPVKAVKKPAAKVVAKKPAKAVAAPAPIVHVVPIIPGYTPVVHKKNSRAAKMAALVPPPPAQVVASNAAKNSFMPMTAPSAPTIVPVIPKKDAKLANNWKTKTADQMTDSEIVAMPDDAYMNDIQMAFFRLKLVKLKNEVLANASETTEHMREDTVVVPDPADRATIEEEHALELRTRDRERKLLKKIEQSIHRIDSGDYGYCDETGEAIGVGRLLARPTASLSLEAQERREIKQRMFGD